MYVYVPIIRIPTKGGDEFIPNSEPFPAPWKGKTSWHLRPSKYCKRRFTGNSREAWVTRQHATDLIPLGTFEASMACYIPMVGC